MHPMEIERKSFRIVSELLGKLDRSGEELEIIRRVAHATADIEMAKGLLFHPQAVARGIEAVRAGHNIITDVHMLEAGINKRFIERFGGRTGCFIAHPRVVKEAAANGATRASTAMKFAAFELQGTLAAIGNAPSALEELCRMMEEEDCRPALIVGLPVGFVGAVEAKARLAGQNTVPYIANADRRGGSAAAAAAVNAILRLAAKDADTLVSCQA